MSGVLSPRRRLYPPACKPYGLEAEPEAAGFRPRRTGVRLGRKPLCGLAHRKNISFMNWKLLSAIMYLWMDTKLVSQWCSFLL